FLTNTCKVISFHLQKPLGNSLSCTKYKTINQDLIRKQMLFGISIFKQYYNCTARAPLLD
ncbi:MAG: hypothetical protein WAJ93_06875, partial [Candidatus Nitrosopolaris sp.]